MDSIIQAIDMVKASELASRNVISSNQEGVRRVLPDPRFGSFNLNEAHLEDNRIITQKVSRESRAFDVLRTQVLQEMDKNGWQSLGITSPTPRCGKTTIACNLAISIARLADRGVVLVDLDLAAPAVASCLGLHCEAGMADVLQGMAAPTEIMLNAVVGSASFLVVPGKGSMSHPSDLLASQLMVNTLQTLKREFRNRIIIIDLPSVLNGDEVISVLPRIDVALLVTSAGRSKVADVRDCRKFLEKTPVVRVIVNKQTPFKDDEAR